MHLRRTKIHQIYRTGKENVTHEKGSGEAGRGFGKGRGGYDQQIICLHLNKKQRYTNQGDELEVVQMNMAS